MLFPYWKRQIHWLFSPALAIVVIRWHASSISTQLMAASFAMFAIEQAWMARVDLLAAESVRRHLRAEGVSHQSHLNRLLDCFDRVVITAIGGELCGFYGACLHLGWGAVGILVSLIGFNLFVPVSLVPGSQSPIRSIPWHQRGILTAIDFGVMGLVAIWMTTGEPTAISAALFACVLAFAIAKYGAIAWKTLCSA